MERAKDANLLFMHRDNDTTDEHEPGVLAFFDGKFLSPVNTYVPLPDERFATEESLPPVPTEATAILDLLQPWKRDKWKIEYDEAEKELTDSIRALGRTSGAQFFLEQLKNLLTAHNWSFHKHTFFVGQTRLKAFYTAYKQLVQDYHGGTSSASRYALVYVAVKSHEDDLMIGVGLFYQANRRFPKNVEFMLLALCKVVDEGGELPDMYDVEGTYTEDDLVIAFCYFHTLSNDRGETHELASRRCGRGEKCGWIATVADMERLDPIKQARLKWSKIPLSDLRNMHNAEKRKREQMQSERDHWKYEAAVNEKQAHVALHENYQLWSP
ncbi:hypothetical protein CYMTET_41815 [Cymbomonas tetramitiformis]|uniref:Uncharacterized protein n=1 Tax=Cymbomonas tetramitiformis TaxID=36881 RepID=A0AAE0C6F2_9CHLO|nr:hypothetical protein CYMTET_41815 [Cymbomonas tetramitiformis]